MAGLPDIAVCRPAQLQARIAAHILAGEQGVAGTQGGAVRADVGGHPGGQTRRNDATPDRSGDGIVRASVGHQVAGEGAARYAKPVVEAVGAVAVRHATHQVGDWKADARRSNVPLQVVAHKAKTDVGAGAALACPAQAVVALGPCCDLAIVAGVVPLQRQITCVQLDLIDVQHIVPVIASGHPGHHRAFPAVQAGDALSGVFLQRLLSAFNPHLPTRFDSAYFGGNLVQGFIAGVGRGVYGGGGVQGVCQRQWHAR